ncbi:carboxylate--amine ligase [Phenylobacterium kunshanense]|uniref:Carboxylate--amine ligase n=1 Tax=Phenylobacterium kunshanense TaxID=1445034 RepID=A0A328BIR1_9CAUL|nr:carboxylate--amine ligase [Phenylobacterium kunshanense]RAK66291.1 carboxylate--amine ligase [Phenylobacterium kunshanense]
MATIYVGGAGGAPANNFISSLRASDRGYDVIGGCSSPTDLFLADVSRGHLLPGARAPGYAERLLKILRDERPDFLHVQHDYEVLAISELRDEIHALGVKTFLPAPQTVRDCVDKFASYAIWEKAGVPVPRTIRVDDESDLVSAFAELGPSLWLRATTGGGGRGAVPTDDIDFARMWISRFDGWGAFTAAEQLTADTVTWSSLWLDGDLVVAQTRRRRSWSFGDRTLSGVTGVTAVGETDADPRVDETALAAIRAIDPRPNGIFSVDMTLDRDGLPRPTEINIARFFTTIGFFTAAGLNMPEIYCELGLQGRSIWTGATINPLPKGLVWIRGMDVPPQLHRREELDELVRTGMLRRAP